METGTEQGKGEAVSDLHMSLQDAAAWLVTLADNGPDLMANAHRKAAHEAVELAAEPTPEEWADVAICLVGTALGQGWDVSMLADAVAAKVRVNRARTWRQEPDGTWQHVQGGRMSGDLRAEQTGNLGDVPGKAASASEGPSGARSAVLRPVFAPKREGEDIIALEDLEDA